MKKVGIFVIGLFLMVLCAGSALAADSFESRTFPVGAVVIPVDDKQYDAGALDVKVYGLLHMLSRKGITFFRIVEDESLPADAGNALLFTDFCPGGCYYRGGPFVVLSPIPADVLAAFPTVEWDTLTAAFTWNEVVRVSLVPKILVIQPTDEVSPPLQRLYDKTDLLLNQMGIPYGTGYEVATTAQVQTNPAMLFSYGVVVDDCSGWEGYIDPPFTPLMSPFFEEFVSERGGELIYTDISQYDLVWTFLDVQGWMYIYNNAAVDTTYPFTVHPEATFIGQYSGPLSVPIYTESYGAMVSDTPSPFQGTTLLDSLQYPALDPYTLLPVSIHAYANFYFPRGKGIIQSMGYHTWNVNTPPVTIPQESYNLVWQFLANKLFHPPVPGCECCTMGGGGKLWGKYAPTKKTMFVDYAINLHCDYEAKPNVLTVQWGANNRFTLTELTQSFCSDNPDYVNGTRNIPFDTIEGAGIGKYNFIMPGYKVFFKFMDTAQVGKRDWGYIRIESPTGQLMLEASGYLSAGGHASYNCRKAAFK